MDCLSTNQNDASSTTSSDWPGCIITLHPLIGSLADILLEAKLFAILAAQRFELGYVSEWVKRACGSYGSSCAFLY
jgi:hypothetical protein